MSTKMLKEPSHFDANAELIFEDMQVMNDFELHRLSKQYPSLQQFRLTDDQILDSGKFSYLSELLPDIIDTKRSKVLLFSQFTTMLDIIEELLRILKYHFLRLDGTTPVVERKPLIDQFQSGDQYPIFLLSTKAGGLGINLCAANYIVLHDLDFNPHNDRQAVDRCHRVGQEKEVTAIKLVVKETVEENIFKMALEKLKLEEQVCNSGASSESASSSTSASRSDSSPTPNAKEIEQLLSQALRFS